MQIFKVVICSVIAAALCSVASYGQNKVKKGDTAKITPDYTVSSKLKQETKKAFKTVQKAVNQACLDAKATARTTRIYIAIEPGTYKEIVYIPDTTDGETPAFTVPPITLYGTDKKNTNTVITYDFDANITASGPTTNGKLSYTDQMTALFNYSTDKEATFSGIYKMYLSIASKGTSGIGTGQTPVVWIKNGGFQMKDITVSNTFNEDYDSKSKKYTGVQVSGNGANEQAVAVEIDGIADKSHFENVRFLGNQDTLYIKSNAVYNTIRVYFHNCYVEGDVDFIFGRATAFFSKCEIKTLTSRTPETCITAPSTNIATTYGFVFDDCDFTTDNTKVKPESIFLTRQWFESIKSSPWSNKAVILGTNSNPKDANDATHCPRFVYESAGKTIVLNSRLGSHINKTSPWSSWNDAGTPYYRPTIYSSDTYKDEIEKVLKANSSVNDSASFEKLYPKGIAKGTPYLALYKNKGAGFSDKTSASNPILTPEQAAQFTIDKVLGVTGKSGAETVDPWNPSADPFMK
jgi:pectin methylesterase-like acyl-CoA thioesterase